MKISTRLWYLAKGRIFFCIQSSALAKCENAASVIHYNSSSSEAKLESMNYKMNNFQY